MSRLLAALGVVLALASAVHAAPLTQGTLNGRTYLIADQSANCPGFLRPSIVMGMHGHMQTAQQFADSTGFHTLASCIITVYPQGLDDGWNSHRDPPLTQSEIDEVDDIGFLLALADAVKAEYDTRALYLTGISNGGRMAYALACHHSDEVTAVGVVATTFTDSDCPAPILPVPLKHIHGMNDNIIPWEGDSEDPPPLDGIERWRIANGCAATTTTGGDGSRAYDGCFEPVEYRLVGFMGHCWPGNTGVKSAFGHCPVSNLYDATAKLKDFFARF